MNGAIFLETGGTEGTAFVEEGDMAPEAQLVKDVVCGMMVDPATAAAKRTHDGRDFYFCSKGCARAFDANPEEFSLEEY
jgi:YHS domain-containing protein